MLRIIADVKAGFVVRTRADADTVEARTNDTKRRDAALASGAQYVSTSTTVAPTRDSRTTKPGSRAAQLTVCNPVRAAQKCAGGLQSSARRRAALGWARSRGLDEWNSLA